MKRESISEEYLGAYVAVLGEVSETGRTVRRPELDGFRDLGERAAEEGHGMQQLVALYLAKTRRVWGTLPGVARAAAAGERARTGDAVLGAVEAAISAVGEGYERAQRMAVRQEEAERREFVDDLLHGRSNLGQLAERAQRFGLHLADRHAVAVVEGVTKYEDANPVVRRIERELFGRFEEREVLLTTKDGRLVCVVGSSNAAVLAAFADLAERPGPGYLPARRVALGREHVGASGVVRSYEEAVGTLELADTLVLEQVRLDAAELLVFPVLLRDRAAIADLVGTVLGPLTRARGGAEPLLGTILECSAAGYVNAEAARRLGVSVRTLSYRLQRIKTLTGYDPAQGLHRYTLETAAMGARLLGWPDTEL